MPQFTVRMVCKVRKDVTCDCGTAEEARANPWHHAIDETEIDQIDWEVVSVTRDD